METSVQLIFLKSGLLLGRMTRPVILSPNTSQELFLNSDSCNIDISSFSCISLYPEYFSVNFDGQSKVILVCSSQDEYVNILVKDNVFVLTK